MPEKTSIDKSHVSSQFRAQSVSNRSVPGAPQAPPTAMARAVQMKAILAHRPEAMPKAWNGPPTALARAVQMKSAVLRPSPPRPPPVPPPTRLTSSVRMAGTHILQRSAPAVSSTALPTIRGHVTASSDTHDLSKIANFSASAAKKTQFSFIAKGTEATDILLINQYIDAFNSGNGADVPAVTHGTGEKAGMIQFFVNNRIYSTHENSMQLFPVSGTGIRSGAGADDMVNALRSEGKLDEKHYYALKSGSDKKYAQADRETLRTIKENYKNYLKKK